MIISHSRRFVFVHIHKTAGESVTEALAPHLERKDLVVGTTFTGKLASLTRSRTGAGRLKKHSPALRLRAHLGEEAWPEYFKFAVIRDPVDRACSLYAYISKMLARRERASVRNLLFALPGATSADPLNWPESRAYLESASFSEFIRHPAFAMREQWRYVCDEAGGLIVNFVARFENLEADFAEACRRIGVESARLPRRNASGGRTERTMASPEDRALLAAVFHRDYELFGYAPAEAVRA